MRGPVKRIWMLMSGFKGKLHLPVWLVVGAGLELMAPRQVQHPNHWTTLSPKMFIPMMVSCTIEWFYLTV